MSITLFFGVLPKYPTVKLQLQHVIHLMHKSVNYLLFIGTYDLLSMLTK